MTPAERFYRALLRLYPREHRQAYGRLMQQHARDLEQAARERGRLHVAALYLFLGSDGIINAAKEHWSAWRVPGGRVKPVPWSAVLMAIIPGLWMALSRRYADTLAPALNVLGIGYIVLLAIVPPFVWLRARRLPVWALLPLGMLVWLLFYGLQIALSSAVVPLDSRGVIPAIMPLFMLALAAALLALMLRGRPMPTAALAVTGLLLLGGLLLAVHLYRTAVWNGLGLPIYLAAALTGPAEVLLLVAIGLPAARRHNVLALLVVIGGYGLMFADSDYLWPSATRGWPGLPPYLAGMIFLFFVLAPLGLLRARTRLRKAVALFGPATIFLAGRLFVPALVLAPAARIRLGEFLNSADILISLIAGWILYSFLGDLENESQPATPQISV